MCISGKTSSCKHSIDEVLDFDGRSKIEKKIESLCGTKCQTMRKETVNKINGLEKISLLTLAKQEASINEQIDSVSKLITGFDTVGDQLNDDASGQQLEDFQGQVIDFIEKSERELSPEDKESLDIEKLKKDVKDTPPTSKVYKIRNLVRTGFLKEKGRKLSMKDKILNKQAVVKKAMVNLKSRVKAVGTSENIAKGSKAVGGVLKAVGKFSNAQRSDGSIDEKQVISGVLDIVDGISAFLPPPASAVTGIVTSVFNLFTDGGGPTTEEVIQEEFRKQKKFIEEQFAKQETVMKTLLTQTELESVKAKALGVMDALLSRFEFISAYEGLGSCLKDDAISQITERVEYFMDQSDAYSVKHTFDAICPKVLADEKALESQKLCGFLIYTFLVIEEKRREMLTIMISMLSTTEEFNELNYGYYNVQAHQEKALKKWIEDTLNVEQTYCGLFVYHAKSIWEGSQQEKIKEIIDHLAPLVQLQASKCARTGIILR